MSKAFGQQTPTMGEDAVSWQTFSDGVGGIPNTTVNIDWGKLSLQTAGARSVITSTAGCYEDAA
jgi:hypothetical protein